jgi:hypothetical protein
VTVSRLIMIKEMVQNNVIASKRKTRAAAVSSGRSSKHNKTL